jgi:hypothetical protein
VAIVITGVTEMKKMHLVSLMLILPISAACAAGTEPADADSSTQNALQSPDHAPDDT